MSGTALIINCGGLGDGLIELPLLKRMETSASQFGFFHTNGLLFRDVSVMRAAKLKRWLGPVPSVWRKFRRQDWRLITRFINEQKIRRIINLRTLGPRFDVGYFDFMKAKLVDVEFNNLPLERAMSGLTNVRFQMRDLLLEQNIVRGPIDWQVLRTMITKRESHGPPRVGLNMHSGSRFKRWPHRKWVALGRRLLSMGIVLSVCAGNTAAEHRAAYRLVEELEATSPQRAELVRRRTLRGLLEELAGMTLVISVDSWVVHAAAGLGVSAIGLYIVTSPKKWGGVGEEFNAIASQHLAHCANFDVGLGVCRNGYRLCPLIFKEGDGIEPTDVASMVGRLLSSAG